MNKKRRDILMACVETLRSVKVEIGDVKEEEEEARDNTPESLQGTERYDICELACDALEEACDSLQETICKIEEIEDAAS